MFVKKSLTWLAAASATAAAALAVAGGATATTASLNPPPPPGYNCELTGSGAVCHRHMTFENFGGFDGSCPQGFDIRENAHHDEVATRYYDRDGNLARRVLHEFWPKGDPLNILYNSVTGKSVSYWADVTESDELAVPGDLGSITARTTGNLYTAALPGDGLLVHDVGVFTFASDGSILEDRGPKMLFYGQTEKLCAALA